MKQYRKFRQPYRRFNSVIRTAMEKEQYSARQFALEIGVNPSLITRVLSGHRNPPADPLIERMANVLMLDPDLLLLEAGRLPRFLRGFLRASPSLTDEDLRLLKRTIDRIREHHEHASTPARTRYH